MVNLGEWTRASRRSGIRDSHQGPVPASLGKKVVRRAPAAFRPAGVRWSVPFSDGDGASSRPACCTDFPRMLGNATAFPSPALRKSHTPCRLAGETVAVSANLQCLNIPFPHPTPSASQAVWTHLTLPLAVRRCDLALVRSPHHCRQPLKRSQTSKIYLLKPRQSRFPSQKTRTPTKVRNPSWK